MSSGFSTSMPAYMALAASRTSGRKMSWTRNFSPTMFMPAISPSSRTVLATIPCGQCVADQRRHSGVVTRFQALSDLFEYFHGHSSVFMPTGQCLFHGKSGFGSSRRTDSPSEMPWMAAGPATSTPEMDFNGDIRKLAFRVMPIASGRRTANSFSWPLICQPQ